MGAERCRNCEAVLSGARWESASDSQPLVDASKSASGSLAAQRRASTPKLTPTPPKTPQSPAAVRERSRATRDPASLTRYGTGSVALSRFTTRESLDGQEHFQRRLFSWACLQTVIAAAVLLMTLGACVHLFAELGIDLKTEYDGEPCFGMEQAMHTGSLFFAFLPITLGCGLLTAVLLVRAWTQHLRQVGCISVLLWVHAGSSTYAAYASAHGLCEDTLWAPLLLLMEIPQVLLWCCLFWLFRERVASLERAAFRQSRGTCTSAWRLLLLTVSGFSIGIGVLLLRAVGLKSHPAHSIGLYIASALILHASWITARTFRGCHDLVTAVAQREGQDEHRAEQACHAAKVARIQEAAVWLMTLTMLVDILVGNLTAPLWPLKPWTCPPHLAFLFGQVPELVDMLGNMFGLFIFSGAFPRALSPLERTKQAQDMQLRLKRMHAAEEYAPCLDARWQEKVQELAHRGLTVAALLGFYRGLGREYMPHFDPARHTTSDVVRLAIVPLSCSKRSDYARLLMGGVPTRPNRMVTHHWRNLFHDLVATVVADALGDSQYDLASEVLEHDPDLLEEWLRRAGTLKRTYWICAFSVSQHDGICGGNPSHGKDSVTGREHPVCFCGKKKCWNDTEPTMGDGRSIGCEMNKFDDMMNYLAATDRNFAQVIAVDRRFELFSRAWCVAEIAAAFEMGMKQHVKLLSGRLLREKGDEIRRLRIEEMEASRQEDIDEIIAKIPDTDQFNKQIQSLIFNGLLMEWQSLDAADQMAYVGRLARWQAYYDRREKASL